MCCTPGSLHSRPAPPGCHQFQTAAVLSETAWQLSCGCDPVRDSAHFCDMCQRQESAFSHHPLGSDIFQGGAFLQSHRSFQAFIPIPCPFTGDAEVAPSQQLACNRVGSTSAASDMSGIFGAPIIQIQLKPVGRTQPSLSRLFPQPPRPMSHNKHAIKDLMQHCSQGCSYPEQTAIHLHLAMQSQV